MKRDVELFSERLILRRLCSEHAPVVAAYRSLPEIARYQSWDRFSLNDALRLIEQESVSEANIPGTWCQLGIFEALTGVLIGDCGLHFPKEQPQQMEAGITLSPSYQHRGYAAEVVHCLIRFAFVSLQKESVFSVMDVRNTAALNLFTRAGFREATNLCRDVWFKNEWVTEVVFTLPRTEWLDERGKG